MKDKEAAEKEQESGGGGGGSWGAVFTRWLVAVHEGERKGRDIELVVGKEERVERNSNNTEMMMGQRRHVFEEIEFKEEFFETKNVKESAEEEGRVSIGIPPKNALLLMKCRSDPVKMAALANKFWEAPEGEEEEEEVDEQEENDEKAKLNLELERESKESRERMECEAAEEVATDTALLVDGIEGDEQEEENPEGNKDINEAAVEEVNFEDQEDEADNELNKEEPVGESRVTEIFADLGALQHEENVLILVQGREGDDLAEIEPGIHGVDNNVANYSDEIVLRISNSGEEQVVEELEDHELAPEPPQSVAAEEETVYPEKTCQEEQSVTRTQTREDELGCESKEETMKSESTASVLPDCLLLMMCEPKLFMEVSKETWVCSADIIRYLPMNSRPVNKTGGGDKPKSKVNKTDAGDESKRRGSIDSNLVLPVQQLQQPSRSRCSTPSAAAYGAIITSSSMANMVEQ